MEHIRCHGVTTEVPAGLSDDERAAFITAFTAAQVASHPAPVVGSVVYGTESPAHAHQED